MRRRPRGASTPPAASAPSSSATLTGGPLAINTAARAPGARARARALRRRRALAGRRRTYDWAYDAGERSAAIRAHGRALGHGRDARRRSPRRAPTTRGCGRGSARLERLSSSPGELRAALARSATDFDVRAELGELRVPTLILHRTGDRLIDVRHSRYLAERIPGARYVELEGVDNLPSVGDSRTLLGEIEEFLTGGRSRHGGARAADRSSSATSSARPATPRALGDAGWRDLLGAHDAVVRREIDRFGGREVKTIGDALPDRLRRRAVARGALRAGDRAGRRARSGLERARRPAHRRVRGLGDDVGGMAVHIAARVAELAEPGEVLASGTTTARSSGRGCSSRTAARTTLNGVPGRWPLFARAR